MKIPLTVILLLQFMAHSAIAQPSRIAPDLRRLSAMEKSKGFGTDTAYIDLLVDCAYAYYTVNLDSFLFYSNKAYYCAEKSHYVKWEAKGLRGIGLYYWAKRDYVTMLPYLEEALSLAQTAGATKTTADIFTDLAQFHREIGEDKEALEELNKACDLARQSGNAKMIAEYLELIADNYDVHGDFDQALNYYRQSLQMIQSAHVEDSLDFINEDKISIGGLLLEKRQYQSALEYLLPALQYYRKTRDKFGIVQTSADIGRSYSWLGKYQIAMPYALESFSLAKQMNYLSEQGYASRILSRLYEKEGNFRNSLKYLQLFDSIADSLRRATDKKKTFQLDAKYAYEKKEAALRIEHAKEISLQASRLKTMRMEISLYVLATVLLTILVVVLYRGRIIKEKNNRQLKAKNQEIAEQNTQIERQAADLRHINQQKDQFFSIIAHDLKGPLNSLKALLDLLKKKSLSEVEIAKTINSLKNNVDNSADLVNNLLYWARSQMNGIQVTPVVLPTEPLAAAALNLFDIQAAEKKIIMENKLEKDFTVYADKDMVQLVFRNTVSNAIKFCRPEDKITIEAGAVVGGFVEIRITDTGTGIKEEILKKLNSRQSVTTSGTSAELGTGLGLMLCHEFIERNGGQFRVLSEWGKGTQICFTLPSYHLTNQTLQTC
jgi:two-component system sensor histidine kinase/response regulator